MGEVARKPDLREQVGVSVNASSLQSRSYETPLDRVAAVGAAALDLQLGATAKGAPIAAVRDNIVSPQDRIAAELITELWHIRYGAQFDLVPQAVTHFAQWMLYRGRFDSLEPEARAAMLPKLAARALHEWLSDRCPACGGSGKEERTREGRIVRPRGSMQRNATFIICRSCQGTRRRSACHIERARCLGITREDYDAGRWGATVNAAIAWLTKLLANRLNRPLTVQLERRKKYD
jgi:hypothetical protein